MAKLRWGTWGMWPEAGDFGHGRMTSDVEESWKLSWFRCRCPFLQKLKGQLGSIGLFKKWPNLELSLMSGCRPCHRGLPWLSTPSSLQIFTMKDTEFLSSGGSASEVPSFKQRASFIRYLNLPVLFNVQNSQKYMSGLYNLFSLRSFVIVVPTELRQKFLIESSQCFLTWSLSNCLLFACKMATSHIDCLCF